MDPSSAAQWVAVGGATVLLVWLLRFAATYQSVMTRGAYARIQDLEATVARIDADLVRERARCDGLADQVAELVRERMDRDKRERRRKPESRPGSQPTHDPGPAL